MDLFKFTINDVEYEYLDSKRINDKNYILYTDGKTNIISEYDIIDGELKLSKIDDNTLNTIKGEFNL